MRYEIRAHGKIDETGNVADLQYAVSRLLLRVATDLKWGAGSLYIDGKLHGVAECHHYNADTMVSRVMFTDYVTFVRETYTVTPTIQIVECEPYRVEEQRAALAVAGF